jgi:oxygen-independent coproporphyrinogen-3 oxidase
MVGTQFKASLQSDEKHCAATADAVEPVEGNYFVAVYPPFSLWTEEDVRAWEAALAAPGRDVPWIVYAHVPFCARRCDFCYYLSYADKSRSEIERYIKAVLTEADRVAAARTFKGRTPEVMYVGGGTPSLLSAVQLEVFLGGLMRSFGDVTCREFSVEVAPQTTRADGLAAMKRCGVTRVSMGVQQMNDDVLKASGRIHRTCDVLRAWDEIEAANFQTTNLDLIAGLPGESDSTFMQSLDRVIDMGPDSVTIYPLEVPRNTPLAKALREGTQATDVSGWPSKRNRMRAAFERLERAGYQRLTAYAAVRDTARYPFLYMENQYTGGDVLGLGAGSFGFVNGAYGQNVAHYDDYITKIEADESPLSRGCKLSEDELATRQFVLSLKLGCVRRSDPGGRYAREVAPHMHEPIERFVARGWIKIDADAYRLTAEGLLFVDQMIRQLVLPQHRAASYW